MNPVSWKKDETVAILSMDNGENKWDLDYTGAMISTLDDILLDKEIKALVITSSDEKNFSQGINLMWLMELNQQKEYDTMRKFLHSMNNVFKKILTYPMPVIAAINGHAMGNGAIMSCTCDYRFMRSDRGYFGFPEINVNIPFFPGMIGYLKTAVPPHFLHQMIFTGNKYTGKELEEAGVMMKSCEGAQATKDEAIAFAKTFNKNRGIVAELKRRLHRESLEAMDTEDTRYFESLDIMVTE